MFVFIILEISVSLHDLIAVEFKHIVNNFVWDYHPRRTALRFAAPDIFLPDNYFAKLIPVAAVQGRIVFKAKAHIAHKVAAVGVTRGRQHIFRGTHKRPCVVSFQIIAEQCDLVRVYPLVQANAFGNYL